VNIKTREGVKWRFGVAISASYERMLMKFDGVTKSGTRIGRSDFCAIRLECGTEVSESRSQPASRNFLHDQAYM